MQERRIQSALISTFYKDGLEDLVNLLAANNVTIYSTGGTQAFIEKLGHKVVPVETITGYPSILGGRVKTLHPKVFGGILAMRSDDHLSQLEEYDIPQIDMVVVDLYPFEETVKNSAEEEDIIEKIDIGGISLIRAAAKNFQDVLIIANKSDYKEVYEILKENDMQTTLESRRKFAQKAFRISSTYDAAIFDYFANGGEDTDSENAEQLVDFRENSASMVLRYGENPHQTAKFYGKFDQVFTKHNGKEISFNNLVDIDAALDIMRDFKDEDPSFAILKHTNTCGLARRENIYDAWLAALECDPTSAFGGILIANREIDLHTAESIDEIFYEVLIAPAFSNEALEHLSRKKNRILLQIKDWLQPGKAFKSLLNGVVEQDKDNRIEKSDDFTLATYKAPTPEETRDLEFAVIAAKHLKSNTIALVKDSQLVGMGCGQTSRVDSLLQAIEKAKNFGFDLEGAVMASDAFFPFADCVEIAREAGITSVVHPGGSINDKDSIAYCDEHGMSMVLTGVRHFKH